jgi:hypothetical protein
MGRAIVSQINAFLTVSLFPHEKRWTSASSYVEAENSALKRRGDGVKPNFSVPKAARVIHEGTQIRSLKRQQKAVHNLNATRKDKPAYYTKLTDLVDYVQDAVSGEFQAAAMFELFRPSATTFWVKKASYKHQGQKPGILIIKISSITWFHDSSEHVLCNVLKNKGKTFWYAVVESFNNMVFHVPISTRCLIDHQQQWMYRSDGQSTGMCICTSLVKRTCQTSSRLCTKMSN